MKRVQDVLIFLLLLCMAVGLAGCSTAVAMPTPIPDTAEIVQAVLAELATQQARASLPAEAITPISQGAPEADLGLQEALTKVYEASNPAVVYIIVPPFSSGSGFVYDTAGHIVTNNHVVANGRTFEVVFANGERRAAALVGADVDSDLAVLKVEELPSGISPLPLAQPGTTQVGQFAIAIGNPFGEQGSMSFGIVSALGRSLPSQRGAMGGNYSLPEVVQTDAPINPGNSGGPLLNLQGEVIGVNSAIASLSGTSSGVGFAIPVQAVRQIVPSLIENGRYVYPYMGAGFDDEISLAEKEQYGLTQTRGAYVLSVTPDSPAARAGLIAADPNTRRGGDLIVAIDNQAINNFSDLNAYLVFHTKVGQTITITLIRDGTERTIELTLGERP